MTYQMYEKALSKPRLARYLTACSNNELNALQLYKLNMILGQQFYALLGMFEIAFRNAIDNHYTVQFNDEQWLKTQTLPTGFLSNSAFAIGNYRSKRLVQNAIRSLGILYTHDRLVARLSFGFWINLFAPKQFFYGGQTLHRVFVNKPKGITTRHLFNDLLALLHFRNRIAHHEPICFNRRHERSMEYAEQNYRLLLKLTLWLGYDAAKLFLGLDYTQRRNNAACG